MRRAWVVLWTTRPSFPFLALRVSSLDSMVKNFSPLIWTPFVMTFLGSVLSVKESAMAFSSAGGIVKSADEAQTVPPVTSQMRALSR